MTLKAVLFDFDDTLIDVSASREQRARRAHQRLLDEGYAVRWNTFWHSINALDEDGFYRRGMERVIRDMGLVGTVLGDECIGYWVFRGAEELLALSPGCTELLDILQERYRLGVISNGPADSQAHKFHHSGLEAYFELFLSSGEAGVQKPDPRIFQIALDRLGIAPDESVFVGDHIDLDVIGAHRAGMKAVWYNPTHRFPEHPHILPDAEIARLTDLPAVLQNLT